MGKGRKKTPDKMKIVKGSFRKDRANDNAPNQAPDGMRAPSWLPREAIEHFGVLKARIESFGLNSSSFTEALAMAAIRLWEIEDLTARIEEDGPIYLSVKYSKDDDGKLKKSVLKKTNPAVGQRNEAMRHLQALLSEFGLTPASISKVSKATGENQKESGFGAL